MEKEVVVYLCGPIRDKTDDECIVWREEAKRILKCSTLDPMIRDFRGVEGNHDDVIVNGDLADIRASDILLINGNEPGWGTAMEVYYAATNPNNRGVPICRVAWVEPGVSVSPWLRKHVSYLFGSFTVACDFINESLVPSFGRTRR